MAKQSVTSRPSAPALEARPAPPPSRTGDAPLVHGARPRAGVRQTFAAFGYRDYRILWLSMVGSFTAMNMQMVARGWLAYELAGTYAAVGIVMMAWGIPQLLFSLVGGAVADRVDKRRLMFVTQALIAFCALLTAVLVSIDVMSIAILFALGVVQGAVFAFNMPARQALLPELVPAGGLMNALALNNAAMNATRIVSPALAGVIIGISGVGAVFYIQAVVGVLVLLVLLKLPRGTSHLARMSERGGLFEDIGVGLRYIWGSVDLRVLMLMAFVPAVLGMPYISLLPGFAQGDLGVGPGLFGLMNTVTGIGALIGSIGIASLTSTRRLPLLQATVGIGFGLALAALGLLSVPFDYVGALFALAMLGLCSMSYMTLNNTMIMSSTKPELYGRVMSVYMMTFSVFPLMAGPLGVLADRITAVATFAFLGAGIVVFIVLTVAVRPRYVFGGVRRAEAPAEQAAPAA